MALIAAVFALASLVLPIHPHPAAPFPTIQTDAATIVPLAPGIMEGDYEMTTHDGPLSVHVVGIDLHDPSVRIGAALADGRLISHGETVSSMAARTGAVAGINGDYFDINQTNQPLNLLVQHGSLVRMPMHRWSVAFTHDKTVRFAQYSIAASLQLPDSTVALTSIDDSWPQADPDLFTPAFGPVTPHTNAALLALVPVDGTPPFATYRISSLVDSAGPQPAGYYLSIGAAQAPAAGATIAVSGEASPSLSGVRTAIGGGPLLVRNGAWYADPDGPSSGEFATHMPASGIAVTRDGDLLLFEIDGRQPARSVGVLQPQFAALMIAFGAQTGMQFDGGGSSTLVARMPGQSQASVQNVPSDGQERHVADALLVYSDAPYGPPARLSAMPQSVRALPHASVALRPAITDAGGHPADAPGPLRIQVEPAQLGTMRGTTFVAGSGTGRGLVRMTDGHLHADIPVDVTNAVARTAILPTYPDAEPGQRLALTAEAFDREGYPIALPPHLPWSATGGSIDTLGVLEAGPHDADVAVPLGDAIARVTVTIGEHEQPLAFLNAPQFATAPRSGPGGIEIGRLCPQCLSLAYDFSTTERAAYVDENLAIPERAVGIAADVDGDGNGEILRIALDNAINERFLYTMARVDWHGWRRVVFHIPEALPQPLVLKAVYAIDAVGPSPPVKAAGAIGLRNVRVLLAGSAHNSHKQGSP